MVKEYCVLVHALLAQTTPFALFSSYATAGELKHFFAKSKATHIFVHANFLERLLPVAREQNFPMEQIFILDGVVSGENKRFKSLDSMIKFVRANQLPKESVKAVNKNTLAYLVFSSGTSGLPKG